MTSATRSRTAPGRARRVILLALLVIAAVTLAAAAPGPRLGTCPQGQVKVASFMGAAECTPQQ
jgi:hypothetical protein